MECHRYGCQEDCVSTCGPREEPEDDRLRCDCCDLRADDVRDVDGIATCADCRQVDAEFDAMVARVKEAVNTRHELKIECGTHPAFPSITLVPRRG